MPTTPGAAPEFVALLARAQDGDADALEQILHQTESRLRHSIDRQLGTRLRGTLRQSDVLQNTYLVVLDALPRFTGTTPEAFVAWVTRIVQNDIQRQHRWFGAARRRPPSSTSERNALARILLDPPPTPSSVVAHREQSDAVRRALANLEPDHASIIELAVFQELPFRTIAEQLGRSEGACRMLLLRARAALALELERTEAAE